jgi:hypothetical protein
MHQIEDVIPEIPVGHFAEEIFGDRLDIECRVAALLRGIIFNDEL